MFTRTRVLILSVLLLVAMLGVYQFQAGDVQANPVDGNCCPEGMVCCPEASGGCTPCDPSNCETGPCKAPQG